MTARTQVLGEQVVEQLRELIITGALAPGTHMVESRLSAQFGVSRGPIRDALVQLDAEGLVESRRRGVFARGLSSADITELYQVREAVEDMALRIAANAPSQAWEITGGPLERMREAAQHDDHLTFAHADRDFHSQFYVIAGNVRLEKVWNQIEPTFAVLMELTTAEDIDLGPSYESHVKLRDLMLSGDAGAARSHLREHLVGSRSRLVRAFTRASAAREARNPPESP
ncbi:MAG: GntR family transcriptional regulator [Arachnia sp.]